MADFRASFRTLPQAVQYFRDKVNLPTRTWRDLWQGQHARAFVVAGATRDELVKDLRDAVDRAIVDGESLEAFRKRFDAIVAKHGWSYNGARGWRTRVIYQTNLRTAYMAGKYAQLTDPDVRARHPYWQYRHNTLLNPREQHKVWNGLVLAWDDAWWDTHYPPNGWGCKCDVLPVSERRMRELGKSGPDPAPGGTKGIPEEWRYHVGEAGWGKPLAAELMDEWRNAASDAWEVLTPGDWMTYRRPEKVPVDRVATQLGDKVTDVDALERAIAGVLGGPERVFDVKTPEFRYPVYVNAAELARHIDPARSQYLAQLVPTLSDPYEVWLAFERHRGTGRVALRVRVIRAIETGKKSGFLLVAVAQKGYLEGWTFVPNEPRYLVKQRRGQLIWGRP